MKYGRLSLLCKEGRSEDFHKCLCECGSVVEVRLNAMRVGNTRSCGCLRREEVSERFRTHGRRFTPEYRVWLRIKQCCHNPKHPDYKYYGGRGIGVDDDWLDSFEVFYADMGDRPTNLHTIDRIDNSKGYTKDNCRWATRKEQARNRRNTVTSIIDGVEKPLAEWCEIYNKPFKIVYKRIWRGWDALKALTTEPRGQ